ncbi:MAG: hypothetical protein ACREE0_17690 [Phenylobacterium sp.]
MKSRGILVASFALSLLAGHALAQESPSARFGAVMDSAFGPGAWRMTGGYRTPERENELRAQGALTVPPGVLSRHSTGRPGAPGAYDLVVNGLSPDAAAARLREANAPFRKYFAEGTHGTQGAHLHLEPHAFDLSGAGAAPAVRRLPSVYTLVNPTPAELAFAQLHAAASEGDAALQLQVARAYAEGRGVPRDRVPAFIWTATAATNETASPELRRDAEQALALLSRSMTRAELERARRFVRVGDEPEACMAQPISIVLPLGGRPVEPTGACASQAVAVATTGR